MNRRIIRSGLGAFALVAIVAAATAAFASQCPRDMAKIDAAMASAQLSDADKAKVMEYRQAGEAAHKAGRHQESVETLAKAMEMLKIQ